ncbi:Ig-like domain-containing protein [Candidatus Curtissbacteria bacterium]|nr:Ig-like domain-containing protein [Candidatus Curtissbacteria bacterium]
MEEVTEKRGPIEKGKKGWPVNPFGVGALIVFALVIIFLIAKPLLSQKPSLQEQSNNPGGEIISPNPGDIIRADKVNIEVSPDNPQNVQKVEFWVKTYADNKWQMVGEVANSPFKLEWTIPNEFKNKAVAITSHIFTKDGKEIKDPGGWREGIILLSQ